MPFCAKCGTQVNEGVAFCPSCGAPQGAPAAGGGGAATQTGIEENVAGLLCYVLGWLTGLIFFLIDKRPFVRFHAAQSIVVFGALHIIRIVLGGVFGFGWFFGGWGGWTGFGIGMIIISLLGLLTLILWIVCMVKAYQHEKFEVPLAADVAKSFAGS
jgi:uncharacterized membrane protein